MKAASAFATIARTKAQARVLKEKVQLQWISKEEFEKLHPEAAAEKKKMDALYGNLRKLAYTRGQFKKEEKLGHFNSKHALENLLEDELALVKVVSKVANLLKNESAPDKTDDNGSCEDKSANGLQTVEENTKVAPLPSTTEGEEQKLKQKRRSTIGETNETKLSVQRYWSVLPKGKDSTITKETYTDLMVRLALSLIPEMTLSSATALAKEDAEKSFARLADEGEASRHLDFKFFFDEMFELVDLWCASEQSSEYDQFLGTLFNCVSDGKSLRAFEAIRNFAKQAEEDERKKRGIVEQKKKPKRRRLPIERKQKKKTEEVSTDWHLYKFDGQSTTCRAGMALQVQAASFNVDSSPAFAPPPLNPNSKSIRKGLGHLPSRQQQDNCADSSEPTLNISGQPRLRGPSKPASSCNGGNRSKVHTSRMKQNVDCPSLFQSLSVSETTTPSTTNGMTSDQPPTMAFAGRPSKPASKPHRSARLANKPVAKGKPLDSSALPTMTTGAIGPKGTSPAQRNRGLTLSKACKGLARDVDTSFEVSARTNGPTPTQLPQQSVKPAGKLVSVSVDKQPSINVSKDSSSPMKSEAGVLEVRQPVEAKTEESTSAFSPLLVNRRKQPASRGNTRAKAQRNRGRGAQRPTPLNSAVQRSPAATPSGPIQGLVIGSM